MYLPFDQNNPKIKAIVTIFTAALVVVALIVVYRTIGPSVRGPDTGVQYSLGYVLAVAMGEAVGSGKIIVISFETPGRGGESPVFSAQKNGILDALKNHPEVTISEEVGINISEPMMMELISARDVEQIIKSNPDVKGILSMVGLPRGGPGMIPGLQGDNHPIIVAYDPSGFEIEAWIGSERAAAIAVMNFQEISVPNPPASKQAREFNDKFILVTRDNFEAIGNVAPPSAMPGPPPG